MKLPAAICLAGMSAIVLSRYSIPGAGDHVLWGQVLFTACMGMALLFFRVKVIAVSWFDIAALVLIVYILSRCSALQRLPLLMQLWGLAICFIIVKRSVSLCKIKLLIPFLLLQIGIALILAAVHRFNSNVSIPFSPNKSIWCILLASQLVFILPFVLREANVLKMIVVITGLFLLGYANGRAGWMGSAAGICCIVMLWKKPSIKTVLLYAALLLMLLVPLLLYKPASSSGRVLIYKITTAIIRDNLWLVWVPVNLKPPIMNTKLPISNGMI